MAFTEHIKVALGLESSGFKKGLSGAESKTKSFAKSVKGYLAGALAVGVLVRTTKTIVDFGATIGDIAGRIGVTSEFLQEFQFSATQSGSSAEEAQKALEKLSKSVGEAEIGTKLYVDAFKRLGVSLRDADGNLKSTERITKEVADGLKSVNDPAVKVKTAFDLMGRSGTAMIQVMENGSEGLEEFAKQAKGLGMILSNDAVKALQDASGKIEIFDRSWKVLLGEVAPSASSFLVGVTAYLKAIKAGFSKVIPALELFGKTMKRIIGNYIEKRLAGVKVGIQELRVEFAKFNPFEDMQDVQREIGELDKLKKKQKEVNKLATDMYTIKREVLKENLDLQHASIDAGQDLEQVNNLINSALGNNKKLQVEVNDETSKNDAILDQVLGKRSAEEVVLSRTIEKQKALASGGLDALKVIQSRFDMEDRIQKLLEAGNMSRDEAEKKVRSILDAEEQELQLQEAIKLEKEQQVALKEKKEDRAELLSDLQKEIDARTAQIGIQKELLDIDQQIEEARKDGNKVVEQQLEQKRIQIQLAGQEFDQRQEMQGQLEQELDKKKQIREFAQKELDAMQARANGFDEIADRLEFQMQLEKDVQAVAEAQNITQEEALRLVHRRLGIEAQVAGQRIKANKQELLDKNLLQLADKKLGDAKDREERRRILAAQSVERLNKRIAELRQKGGAFSEREIAKLKALKAKKLDIVLDDKTKEELKKLEVKEQDLQKEQDIRIQEMKKEFQKIKDEEAKQKQKQKEQLDALEKKKQELLDEQTKVATELKTAVDDQSEVIAEALQETGNTIKEKLDSVEVEAKAEFTDSSKTTLAEFAYKISSSIRSINIPNSIKVEFDEYALKIDTEGLATETTLSNISRQLDGKLRNE